MSVTFLGRGVVIVAVATVSLMVPLGASATPPGRNGRIAFTAGTERGDQLFTVRPDGKHLRQITHVDGDAANVDWAPDARHLTFVIGSEESSRVAVADAQGSDVRVLPQPLGVFDDQPSYSPDGQVIYFERFTVATNEVAIWRMASDGSNQRRLLNPFPNGFVTDPNVSPDGRTLSFQGFDGTVTGPAPDNEPARGLFTADIDGQHVRQVRPFSADETVKADWAPDGRRIAVTENANHLRPADSANIVTMRPDGTRLRQVTRFHDGVTNAFLGSYSPDGRWIVYRLEVDGLFALYRSHPDGTHRRAILPPSELRPSLIDWGARTQERDQHH